MACRIAIVLLAGVCWMPSIATAASFDCNKAKSELEKAVCENPDISNLDETLATDYAKAMRALSPEGQQILRDGQKRWLKNIDTICFRLESAEGGSDCVKKQYEDRIKDMQTAAIQIGPYIFSRIDYYFSQDDEDSGSPFEGKTSYPRVDNPSLEALKQWNVLMAPNSEAQGTGWCDGRPGDVNIGFSITSATETAIGVQLSNSLSCHGAAHGYASTHGKIYILMPQLHLLAAEDIFVGAAWKELLAQRGQEAMQKIAQGANVDEVAVRTIVTEPESWSLLKEGLTVTIGYGMVLPQVFGEAVFTVSWDDLRPFLAPNAPIPK